MPSGRRRSRSTAAHSYSTLRWLRMTPLGGPIVPEVYTRVTGSSGRTRPRSRPARAGSAASASLPRASSFLPAEHPLPPGKVPGALQHHHVLERGQPLAQLLPALGQVAVLQDGDLGGAVRGAVADL